jgi:adenosylmethionine-8-amino-7-oxononanoate aminotransferase
LLSKNELADTKIEIWHRQDLAILGGKYPQLSKIRVIGTIAALDVNNSEKTGYVKNVGREIRHHAIAHGVLLYLSPTAKNHEELNRTVLRVILPVKMLESFSL